MGQRELVSYEVTVRRKNGLRPAASMCRLLHVDSAVKGSDQPDGLHSSRCAGVRGVKRKLSDYEDSEQDLPYPQQRQLVSDYEASEQDLPYPQQRQLVSDYEASEQDLPYPQQRQLVLSLSLDKLRNVQQQAEPSLHRSVLLSNTLRQIQHDMKHKADRLPPEVRSLPPPLAAMSAPSASAAEEETRSACEGRADDEVSCREEGRAPDLLFGTFEMVNSTSYLTDLQLDDIFEDIDTSMYDSTDFPVLGGHASRSGGADDNLKAFPACTAGSQRQLCFPDLNDLDHIMEILVRS